MRTQTFPNASLIFALSIFETESRSTSRRAATDPNRNESSPHANKKASSECKFTSVTLRPSKINRVLNLFESFRGYCRTSVDLGLQTLDIHLLAVRVHRLAERPVPRESVHNHFAGRAMAPSPPLASFELLGMPKVKGWARISEGFLFPPTRFTAIEREEDD